MKQYYLAISFMIMLLVLHWLHRTSKKKKSIFDVLYDLPLVIVFVSPIITYVTISLLSEYVMSNPGVLPIQGSTSDWIGFSGSIIGGALTIYAVIFTLKYQDDIRKKDIEFQIMPILQINDIHQIEYNDNEGLSFDIVFENISSYPLKNLKIVNNKSLLSIDGNNIDPSSICFDPLNFLTGSKTIKRKIFIPASVISESKDEITTNLIFDYQDVKGSQTYTLIAKVNLMMRIRDDLAKTTYYYSQLETDFVWVD